MTFWPWFQKSTNQSQKSRFDDFLALAPEDHKIIPRTLDLVIVWPWLQKSTSYLVNYIVVNYIVSYLVNQLLTKMLTMLFSYVVNYAVDEIASNVSYLATCISR